MKRTHRRLAVAKETLKQLNTRQLRDAAGGRIHSFDDFCPEPTYWCNESYPPQCYA